MGFPLLTSRIARADGRTTIGASGARVGMLGKKDFMETLFSISSYTNQTATNLQAATVADVLVNGLESSRMGWFGNFNIRGFTVQSNDTLINGIAGLQPQNLHIPIEFVERIRAARRTPGRSPITINSVTF